MEKERKRNDGKENVKKVSTVTAAGIMMTAMLGMQVSAAESSGTEAAVKKIRRSQNRLRRKVIYMHRRLHLNLPLLQERQCRQVRIRRQYMQDRQKG